MGRSGRRSIRLSTTPASQSAEPSWSSLTTTRPLLVLAGVPVADLDDDLALVPPSRIGGDGNPPPCGERWLDWEVARRLDVMLNGMLTGDVEVRSGTTAKPTFRQPELRRQADVGGATDGRSRRWHRPHRHHGRT